MKIIITVPAKEGKWKVSFGASPFHKRSATVVYNLVERKINRFLGTWLDGKTSILVKYDKTYTNETIASNNINYLLNTLACFLEDYLSGEFVMNKLKKYPVETSLEC